MTDQYRRNGEDDGPGRTDEEPAVDHARLALACLDLTNLNDDCTAADIDALCARTVTPFGHVAAVCVWPQFVAQASGLLEETPVRVATVVNFPAGGDDVEPVVAETETSVAQGANEIDLVLPYRRLRDDPKLVYGLVSAIRAAAGKALLKVILETGEIGDADLIRQASVIAIDAGADFIKTSTGKVPVNATPEAAEIMLTVIADHGGDVGFKPAGGIKTLADAEIYLALADDIVGAGWATPRTFRFGASSLLDDLLARLGGADSVQPASGDY